VPEGVVRDNDDWVYAEFAETPELKGIDIDPGATQAAPAASAPAAAPAEPQAGLF
jgi:penicillin-binding protein 1A